MNWEGLAFLGILFILIGLGLLYLDNKEKVLDEPIIDPYERCKMNHPAFKVVNNNEPYDWDKDYND